MVGPRCIAGHRLDKGSEQAAQPASLDDSGKRCVHMCMQRTLPQSTARQSEPCSAAHVTDTHIRHAASGLDILAMQAARCHAHHHVAASPQMLDRSPCCQPRPAPLGGSGGPSSALRHQRCGGVRLPLGHSASTQRLPLERCVLVESRRTGTSTLNGARYCGVGQRCSRAVVQPSAAAPGRVPASE